MRFEIYLVKEGVIGSDDFVEAVERQLDSRPRIGALALESRRLSMQQVFQVLAAQARSNTPFGRLAVELGMLRESDITDLLAMQAERTRPLSEVLLEMGSIDQATLDRLWRGFHAAAAATASDTTSPKKSPSNIEPTDVAEADSPQTGEQ